MTRDLWITFGLDDVLQTKDPFLHNANSAFRREDLLASPFDETLTNIEDRSWGQEQINLGRKIYYKANATVYHDHGIHQTGSLRRLQGVIGMMDKIHEEKASVDSYYGAGLKFTEPKKVLILMLSDRYGLTDIECLRDKAAVIRNNFSGWDVICMPSRREFVAEIDDLGFKWRANRIDCPDKFGNSLIEDLSVVVEELSSGSEFWDVVAFFDIRNEVPAKKLLIDAETKLMSEATDFVFGGERIYIAENYKGDEAKHTLRESGWSKFFDSEELSPITELSPSRLLIARVTSISRDLQPFKNYSVVDLT